MKTSLGMLVFLSVAPLLATADVVVPIDSVESYVNIRMEPDAASEIVGQLQQGEQMPYVQSVSGWHQVPLEGGGSGYIHEDWTIVVADTDEGDAEAGPGLSDVLVDATEQAEESSAEGPVVQATDAPEQAVTEQAVTEQAEELISEVALALEADAPEQPTTIELEADTVTSEAEPAAALAETTEASSPACDEPAVADTEDELTTIVPVLVGPAGPGGPTGPPGPAGDAVVEGSVDYLMKFTARTIGGNSQIFDDGINIGIGTTTPQQRLEVNGNIQIHQQHSSVAGIMLTQSSGETGYIMHNRASTLTIGAGSVDRITIDRDGYVGIGMSRPGHPIEMASGAHVTSGGVWTNSSSIERKENISDLSQEDALRTLAGLEPVHFNYKQDRVERHVGFIAEDVPELVATADRKGLSTMDIVAVLTKVVQMQQQKIEELEARISK